MISVTDLEIEEAIREAWTILYVGAPPSARRLAAALLAVTGSTQAHPHWVTGQSGEAHVFPTQDNNLTAELPLR